MKIKCIYSTGLNYLTIDKTYEVIAIYNNDYLIITDDDEYWWYHKYLFKPLSEYRNEKIDKILGK